MWTNKLCMKSKKNILHLFWNWFYIKHFIKICVITLPLNAIEIYIGISKTYFENQDTVNYILLMSKNIHLNYVTV